VRPKSTLLLLLLCVLGAGLAGPAPTRAEAELSCKVIPELASQFLRRHVEHRRLTDELQVRTAQGYIRRMDPSKTLLLQSEVQDLEAELAQVFEKARKGDCSRLEKLQKELVTRYARLEGWVREEIEKDDFAVDPNTELVIDPGDRGHPLGESEQRDLLRRQIDFQLANYLSAGTPLDEAKERLVHRYELFTKRAHEVDTEDLYAGYLGAFASSLDPHSDYLSPDYYEDFQITMTLSLEGIGVALSSRDGYSIVERILPGGAANRTGGLRPEDRIIAVAQEDGEAVDVIDMALRDVVRLIRGKRGTPVRLTVLRKGATTERFDVEIVRDKIDLEEQAASLRYEMVPAGDRELKLAVIELTSFYGDKHPGRRQCAEDVARLLAQAQREGADGLLLDLSRNGGGLLDFAIEISGFFVDEGPIVAVRDRRGPLQVLVDPHEDVRFTGPIVVLISRASASASEILAGALKDYRRAVIVGDDHTFGKGTVQTVVPLPDGLGALKMTTAMFFRPGGLSTQRSGVRSDLVIPSLLNTERFGEGSQPHALPSQQVSPFLNAPTSSSEDIHWRPVGEDTVQELARRSEERVEASEVFRTIERELAKNAARNGVVRVAEILDPGDASQVTANEEEAPSSASTTTGVAVEGQLTAAADSTPDSASADGEEEEPTPQLEEALQVLQDLVTLQQQAQSPN
jgi:carboxyl-terminal processing protease